MRERTHLDTAVNGYRALERELSDSIELIEMGEAEGDQTVVDDAEKTLLALKDKAAKLELESLLSGEADANDCYVEVNAGAGGTEAQDWAEMLLRMYLRWAEAHGYKTEWLEESAGEEAGIKSATVQIKGHNAYGWLKTEAGVHRLVRISPYDSQARRHTSFASVAVSPVIDDKIAIEVLDKDLRIDTYRASGAGGQHINKTDWLSESRTYRPTSWCSVSRSGPSIRTARRPSTCCVPACTRRNSRSARMRPPPLRRPSRISAGGTKSAPTCCSLIRW